MPSIDLKLKVSIDRTPRVYQVEGIFDLEKAAESVVELKMEVDLDAKPWSIGLITGPSGCGKSSIARHLFEEDLIEGYDWDDTRAIVDGFGELGVNETIKALSSVGFSSPPAWLRPFKVLSNGERFRVNLARAITDTRPLTVIDEFSSVVDRTVARIGSSAVAREIRKTDKRLVAVSCHDDLVEWLQPDWVLEPHVGLVTWRSVQPRPPIELDVIRCSHEAWDWFAPHHYLSRKLNRTAKCFLGFIEGRPAAFGALLSFPHPKVKKTYRLSRTVVLPDFQGCGISSSFCAKLGAICNANGYDMVAVTAHPALINARIRSKRWKLTRKPGIRSGGLDTAMPGLFDWKVKRMTASFKYMGGPVPPSEVAQARMMWNGV